MSDECKIMAEVEERRREGDRQTDGSKRNRKTWKKERKKV